MALALCIHITQTSQGTYPHLYRVALDLMPLQVERVSCKRIFSTSEHTKALLDGRISLNQFETLERIKYSSGKACLQDIVWKNLEREDKVKGTLPDAEIFEFLLRTCEEQSEDDEAVDSDWTQVLLFHYRKSDAVTNMIVRWRLHSGETILGSAIPGKKHCINIRNVLPMFIFENIGRNINNVSTQCFTNVIWRKVWWKLPFLVISGGFPRCGQAHTPRKNTMKSFR